MIKKGFLTSGLKSKSDFLHHYTTIERVILFLGILILVSSLIFMILNLENADTLVTIWFPFMIAGVVLVFMSLVMKFSYDKAGTKMKDRVLHDKFQKNML
ncbi:MAG: hypothetical protein IH595_12880 [Bacteroidales bacterium]|nr:hypothetical protein [Bacteroidales bacterium]